VWAYPGYQKGERYRDRQAEEINYQKIQIKNLLSVANKTKPY